MIHRTGTLVRAGVLLALLVAPPVRAAGISIGWDDCRALGSGGFQNKDFGCQSAINEFPLFPAFVLATPVDSVLSMELVIDVDVAADVLPEWWRMDPGGCRDGGWQADATPPVSCEDAWAGLGAASSQGWLPGSPGGSARHGRLLVAASAIPGELATLSADIGYAACRVRLRTNNTLTCEGCSTPACLVFNSVLLRRATAASVEEIFLATPESPGSNMVQWQAGAGADCLSVPVRRATWGAVKALYR